MSPFLAHANIISVIRQHAREKPTHDAVILVPDPSRPATAVSLSYRQLDVEARRIAAWLQPRGQAGDRVMLLYSPGVNFAAAFIGCIYAGMVAVPAPLPGQHLHQQRRVRRIATDANVIALLTDGPNLQAVTQWAEAQELGHIACLATDSLGENDAQTWTIPAGVGRTSLALLQYTSGSTGNPKGVMVSHHNLLHNADSLCRAYGLTSAIRFGGWIPLFHDMGLMGLLLPALLLGTTCILMTPTTFLKRPYLWLRMISDFQIGFTAAPNFAYELCTRRITDDKIAEVDLSCLQFATNGSELVLANTIESFTRRFASHGFGEHVICPCYGMAETTLFVSGTGRRAAPVCSVDVDLLEQHRFSPRADAGRKVVSCGAVHDFDIRIVDPNTREVMPSGGIGEIWLRGESVTQGYWQDAETSAKNFGVSTRDGSPGYFRTGDLGAIHEGELYLTGRHKEILVVHGRNLYPQDIELEVRGQHPELAGAAGAVFTVSAPHEEVVLTHELRGQYDETALPALASGIKTTVMQAVGVRVAAVVLLRPGGVLRTTSGKIQRGAMRAAFLQRSCVPIYEDVDPHLQALRDVTVSTQHEPITA